MQPQSPLTHELPGHILPLIARPKKPGARAATDRTSSHTHRKRTFLTSRSLRLQVYKQRLQKQRTPTREKDAKTARMPRRSRTKTKISKRHSGSLANAFLETRRVDIISLLAKVPKGNTKRLAQQHNPVLTLPRLPAKVRVLSEKVMGFSKCLSRVPVRSHLEEIKCE